jgi:hypothetical protein
MSQDAHHTLFQVQEDTGPSAHSAVLPALKTWATPKVIVGTVDDTETGASNASDNSAPS